MKLTKQFCLFCFVFRVISFVLFFSYNETVRTSPCRQINRYCIIGTHFYHNGIGTVWWGKHIKINIKLKDFYVPCFLAIRKFIFLLENNYISSQIASLLFYNSINLYLVNVVFSCFILFYFVSTVMIFLRCSKKASIKDMGHFCLLTPFTFIV